MMKHLRVIPSVLAMLVTIPAALAQSTTVDVELTLITPGSSCTFSSGSDLEYGTVERPPTGTATVTINARTGARSASGTVVSGSSTVGQIRLLGQHVSSYTVTTSFPSELEDGNEQLSFSGAWAQSTSSSSGYSTIGGNTYDGTAGGVGSSLSRYFRFGGTVGNITWSRLDGTYTGSIATSATCN